LLFEEKLAFHDLGELFEGEAEAAILTQEALS
jgi:hypothetical protein